MKPDLCVIGLGYIGLPTAALFADAGLNVAGADINAAIVSAIARGEAPFDEPGLADIIARVTTSGALRVATSPVKARAFIVAVGTPLAGHTPVLDHVGSACRAIAPLLERGDLVVIESTVPPGTTRGIVRALLEQGSGLRAGDDFFLAQCPERAIPGTAVREMRENERLVGGIDEASGAAAKALYAKLVRAPIHLTDALTSEIVKLAENTYRDVNIALANELSDLCEANGADVWKVIALANKHPRVHLHLPGPGVGGHCIPVAPWFLVASAPGSTPLLKLSRSINDARAAHVVGRTLGALAGAPRPSRIVVAGVAYKAGVDDARESPALPIIEGLEAAGHAVVATDPRVDRYPRPIVALEEALVGADALVIIMAEADYRAVDPERAAKLMRTRVVYDTCRALDAARWRDAGFEVVTLGRGPGAPA